MAERYIKALTDRPKLKRRLKVVAACGNGTAGAFAPQVLEAIGCEVVPLDADLDYTFPNHNPNPEDMKMLHAYRRRCSKTGPTSASPSTATATAAASSPTTATRFSPTRSASCWRAISRRFTRTRSSSPT